MTLNTDMFSIEPLEDNAFVLLRHEGGAVASIHSSLTQWSNLFRLEFLCAAAVVAVLGLGSSLRRSAGGDLAPHRWAFPH